jgi:hypothetical protein
MLKTENKNEATMVCQFNVHHGSNKMSIAFLLRIYAEVYSIQLYVIKSVHPMLLTYYYRYGVRYIWCSPTH